MYKLLLELLVRLQLVQQASQFRNEEAQVKDFKIHCRMIQFLWLKAEIDEVGSYTLWLLCVLL